jgi:polar amino acid transport system substrate-binding protein
VSAPADVKAQFAPTGVLRAGINLGNPVIAQRDPAGGDPKGVGAALARELAKRIGVDVAFTSYETAGKLADAVKEGAWDVAFLAIDPARAADIDFSAAYVHIEGTYMVANLSSLRSVAEVDRPGVRIAVGLKTAYDLHLTREIRHAQLVRSASSRSAIDQFLAEQLEAVAGVRQPLEAVAKVNRGLRVFADSFMVIRQASGVPRGRKLAAGYLEAFIEEMKSSGFVARALAESGQSEVAVAPPAQLA